MQVLYEAGFTNIGKEFTDEQTYLFGGRVGSLDHVLASESLVGDVTDADIWNINSVESIGLEYSRYNANVTDLYAEGPFRSSDHDPLIMGLNRSADDSTEEPTEDPTDDPSDDPTDDPTGDPSEDPTDDPSTDPSQDPSDDPTDDGRDDDEDGSQDDDHDGDRGDDGQGDDDQKDDGTLPRTGTGLTALAVGGGLLVVGAIALIAARRRLF